MPALPLIAAALGLPALAAVLLLRWATCRDDRRLAAWHLAHSWSRISRPAPVLAAAGPVRQVIECGGCGRARPYCPHCGHKLTVETVPAAPAMRS